MILNSLFRLLILFISISILPFEGVAQASFEINKIYPYISISKEKIKIAHTLCDLNSKYKASWIREYKSVEIIAYKSDNKIKAISKNDTLNQQQKDLLLSADPFKNISVKIQYLPENTLTHNEIKEMEFSIEIAPEVDATFVGGQKQLKKYLLEHAINKISDDSFQNYDLAAIKFTVSETGKIQDAHIVKEVFRKPKDEKTDQLLLDAICNMPDWKPAEFSSGIKTKQEFAFTVGNMESCFIPVLSIRKY